jgi:hypothetical protein
MPLVSALGFTCYYTAALSYFYITQSYPQFYIIQRVVAPHRYFYQTLAIATAIYAYYAQNQ